MTSNEDSAILALLGILLLRKTISRADYQHIEDILDTGEVKSRGHLDKID